MDQATTNQNNLGFARVCEEMNAKADVLEELRVSLNDELSVAYLAMLHPVLCNSMLDLHGFPNGHIKW